MSQSFKTIWEFVVNNLEWVFVLVSASGAAGFGFHKLISDGEKNGLKQQVALLEAKLKNREIPPVINSTVGNVDVLKRAAAAVCYRVADGKIEFLINKTSGRRWTFPKGRVKLGETSAMAAERNALEEAGAAGRIDAASFAVYKHWKQELKVNNGSEWLVEAFLMDVERVQKPIEEHRDPMWSSPKEASNLLALGRFPPYTTEFARIIQEATTEIRKRHALC